MYGNFSKANMDTQTSSHMLLKNNSTEALNQILFPAREREIFEHLVFYYILLYCGINATRLENMKPEYHEYKARMYIIWYMRPVGLSGPS